MVLHAGAVSGHDIVVRRADGVSVDGRWAAGRGRRRRDVRAAVAGDDPGARLYEPSARQFPRRLWRRAAVRLALLLHEAGGSASHLGWRGGVFQGGFWLLGPPGPGGLK